MNVAARKRTVYHISPLRLWLVPAMFIIFAIFMLTLAGSDTGTPDTRKIAIYMGIFFLAFAAVIYLILRRTRLVLSAESAKLYQFGYQLETDWDNIAYIYDEPGAEGLVLRRPMDCLGASTLSRFRNVESPGGEFSGGGRFYSPEQIQLIAERRFIPIDAFAYWLKKGLLRDDLIRSAPALGDSSKPGE
jgi:hypothetical protein